MQRQRILASTDRGALPGEIGALLRKKAVYSSHLATPEKRGVKADSVLTETPSAFPKKVLMLLELLKNESPPRKF